MSIAWYLLPILLPALLSGIGSLQRSAWPLMLAALPSLLLAIFYPSAESVRLDWLLLGMRLGLDETGRLLLGASALVWLLAGAYTAGGLPRGIEARRFRVFFLLAMSGNFSLILAQDMLTFYLGFTLMGLSAYGLVAHRASVSSRRAGRLYLGWTITGEVLLFSAIVMLAYQTGGTDFSSLRQIDPSALAVMLLVMGFGIKLALPGLHPWLPLTYAAAPAAGVAVLSGPMISAGLLGWLRFLPPGQTALIPWGEFLILIGVIGVLLGVGVGLLQKRPRLVLAYSSISKMGLLASGFGIALAHPADAPWLLSALMLFTVHHLLVKSALFLGVDLLARHPARRWILLGLSVLGLALIGAPFTSGALAKVRLVSALPEQTQWFGAWLALVTFATTLLMGRLAFLLHHQRLKHKSAGPTGFNAWALLLLVIVLLPFILLETGQSPLSGALPMLAGLLLAWLLWHLQPRTLSRLVGLIPPGDLYHYLRRPLWRVCKNTQPPDGEAMSHRNAIPSVVKLGPRNISKALSGRKFSDWSGLLWLSLASLLLLAMIYTLP